MRYESIAARLLLALTVLLWTGVLCAKVTPQPDDPKGQALSLNTETVPSPEMSSIWLGLNDDLLSCICQFCGPVNVGALGRGKIIQVLGVQTTLSSLFENLKYFGTIEPDDVLAYYPLLSELSFIKKRYPDVLENMLMTWPLPKGNLTLSLLISTGPIRKSTFDLLASYLPYISDKSVRVDAVNYCLDACAKGSMDFSYEYYRIGISASEPRIVRKLKRISSSYANRSVATTSSLLHYPPAELDPALGNDLNKGLAEVVAATGQLTFHLFCMEFIKYPTTLWDTVSMQDIFERNARAFQDIFGPNPRALQDTFTRNLRTFQTIPLFFKTELAILSTINKIKFGASPVIMAMGKAERIVLFESFNISKDVVVSLVFTIWAREDVSADAWGQFATYSFDTYMLSKLAFDLDRFFENCFGANLFKDEYFIQFLKSFKYCPNSRKKQQFHALLREKVKERPEVVQAVFWDDIQVLLRHDGPFRCLVEFFIEQDDKEELQALNGIISQEIASAPSRKLDYNPFGIARICQRLGGGVDGPLGRLAVRVRGVNVLDCLVFHQIRANDVREMLNILGIEWDQMNAALASLSDTAAHGDELAEVLKTCCSVDRHSLSQRLPYHHSLWFYLSKAHPEKFARHMDISIRLCYL